MEGVCFVCDLICGGLLVLFYDVVNEIGFDIELIENNILVWFEVVSVCEILGFDLFVLVCEGCIVVVVVFDISGKVLEYWWSIWNGE